MKTDQSKVPFRLNQIITEQFALIGDGWMNATSEADVRTTIRFQTVPETKAIYCKGLFEFFQKKSIFMLIEIGCMFEIEANAYQELMPDPTQAKVIVPQGLASHLAVITVGTARGALHAKTEHSSYNKFFIPPIDLTRIITGDILIENGQGTKE